MKQIIIAIFLVFLSIKRTDGFRTDLITKYDKIEPQWNLLQKVDILKIKNILNQDFVYLTRGRECFIFESQDKNYVIKFFDSSRYYTKYFFPSIKLPKFLDAYRQKHYNRRKNKLNFNMSSAKLAYDNLKDDAVLEYVHLNKTNYLPKKFKLINKCGKAVYIDLDNIIFIVQKKCDIFYKKYESSNDNNYKKKLILAFLEMTHNRTKKLVIDDDIGKKRRNWGLYQGKAVTIDIGRWYFDEKLATLEGYKKEMLKATKILRKYIKENEPEKLEFIEKKLNKYFEDFEKAEEKSSA